MDQPGPISFLQAKILCVRNAAVMSLNVTILAQQTTSMIDSLKNKEPVFACSSFSYASILLDTNGGICVTGYRKRAHLAQELIFQNKQLKYVTPLDFVHNSDSLQCYNFSQEDQFFML